MTFDDIPTLVDIETRVEVIDVAANEATNKSILVEVGVFMGGTIFRLASRIKERKINCDIYAVDNFEYGNISEDSMRFARISRSDNYYERFIINRDNLGLTNLIKPIMSDSIQASKKFWNNSIDFVFLDGDHNYPTTHSEITAWWPKIKKGGVLAGHDYPSDGVTRAVVQFFGENYKLTSNKATYFVKKS